MYKVIPRTARVKRLPGSRRAPAAGEQDQRERTEVDARRIILFMVD
jgi:hypothetical protein